MDIVQLKYFKAVADSGSFSEAAEIMFSAQSTVSKQIAALEKELNVQLFDRSKRRITMTEHGKVFLTHAQTILNDYTDMIKEMESITSQDDNTAVIRATTAMLPYNILSYVSQFKSGAPWANVIVEEFDGEDIMKMLRESECDLAFFRVGKFDDELYEKLPILVEKYVAVLPASHPLAGEKSISLSQLEKENFILCRQNSCLHRTAVNACNSLGFEPAVVATSNHTTNIFEMVGMNLGVSLLLEKGTRHYMNDTFSKHISIVPLDETFTVEVAFARYKKHRHTKASLALWEYVKKTVETKKHIII
ncbi:MAG: LysR family transcriptional regulator [Oscillospiraceae bacterium]|nr:LysR family transcriptional regulator [Oscillospiraceae bacterium]